MTKKTCGKKTFGTKPASLPVCSRCVNAYVDNELEPGFDFSSRSLGESSPGYRIMLNTGNRQKTNITLERWNADHKQWEVEGYYIPKYCPECGRHLVENEDVNIELPPEHCL